MFERSICNPTHLQSKKLTAYDGVNSFTPKVMFGKKPPSEPSKSEQSSQLQSFSNVTLTGGMVQIGQAGGNLQQSQTGNLDTQQQGITGAEVVALLERLEAAVRQSALNPDQQEEFVGLSTSCKTGGR
jgi:hypothetical protein